MRQFSVKSFYVSFEDLLLNLLEFEKSTKLMLVIKFKTDVATFLLQTDFHDEDDDYSISSLGDKPSAINMSTPLR